MHADNDGVQILEYTVPAAVTGTRDDSTVAFVVRVPLDALIEEISRYVLRIEDEGAKNPASAFLLHKLKYLDNKESLAWLVGQRNTDFPYILWDDSLPIRIDRWIEGMVIERNFIGLNCQECGCDYSPEEMMIDTWSGVFHGNASGGNVVFCPQRHCVCRNVTWLS